MWGPNFSNHKTDPITNSFLPERMVKFAFGES